MEIHRTDQDARGDYSIVKKKPETGLQYIGQGCHLDVPRRDLTPDEVKQYGRAWLLSLQCPNTGRPMYAEIETETVEQKE